jgi:radical SAM superfamily enzyme YgiQ (UPF0313 family)
MRILFISPNREEINMRTWPLGLACVAEATRASGHEVRLVDFMAEQNPDSAVKQVIDEFHPDLIGISVRNIDDQSMQDTRFLLDQVKTVVADCQAYTDARIVLGGAGYSMFPSSSLEYLGADMGIQGEGETVFADLIQRIERNSDLSETPGLYLPGKGLQGNRIFAKDLDRLPLPNVDLLDASEQGHEDFWLPVQTRRGCAKRCSYCSTPMIEGRLYRSRSPEIVVQWLETWVDAGIHRMFFVDNTFNLPTSYTKALCSRIIDAKLALNWRCIVYPENIDEELVMLMARAGCTGVSLGFESGNQQILHSMNKRFKLEDVRSADRLLVDHGIQRMGFLLLGGPGETRESVEESLQFADSLSLDALRMTMGIRIYPNTDLARTAVEEGVIEPDDDLLFPKFYMTHAIEEWILETVEQWMGTRPNWIR